MAPSTSGFLAEYPLIRVDRFTAAPVPLPASLPASARADLPLGATHFAAPAFFLLTHTHSDHLCGLEQRGHDAAPIYCSPSARAQLLRYERVRTRAEHIAGAGDVVRPYRSLCETAQQARVRGERAGGSGRGRDLLVALPLHTPTLVPYAGRMQVRLTLLDSNHMPGGVIFLVEGERGAVIHTGDLRAEPWYVEALVREPLLRPYIAAQRVSASPAPSASTPRTPTPQAAVWKRESNAASLESTQGDGMLEFHAAYGPLRNIYIDDEAFSCAFSPVTKADATRDMLSIMRRFPACTRFFLDAWCWGYEELIHAIRREFKSKVHVDRYKHGVYEASSDADAHLPDIVTQEAHEAVRFHACEKTARCALIDTFAEPSLSDSPRPLIVEIKLGDGRISTARGWARARADIEMSLAGAAAGKRAWPRYFGVPYERHSPLPEIRSFVAAFRPLRVTPNTGTLQHWFLMAKTFGAVLAPGGAEATAEDARGALGEALWRVYSQAWAAATCKGSVAALPGVVPVEQEEAVAEELQRFHGRARRLFLAERQLPADADAAYEREKDRMRHRSDDVSQPESLLVVGDDADGYEADASGIVASGMPSATDMTTVADRSMAPPLAFVRPPPPPPRLPALAPSGLDEILASRYLHYADMCLGWRIQKSPAWTQARAWRAVRKKKPELAREVEEAVHAEHGTVPLPWSKADKVRRLEPPSEPQPTVTWLPPQRLPVASRDVIVVSTLGDGVGLYRPRRLIEPAEAPRQPLVELPPTPPNEQACPEPEPSAATSLVASVSTRQASAKRAAPANDGEAVKRPRRSASASEASLSRLRTEPVTYKKLLSLLSAGKPVPGVSTAALAEQLRADLLALQEALACPPARQDMLDSLMSRAGEASQVLGLAARSAQVRATLALEIFPFQTALAAVLAAYPGGTSAAERKLKHLAWALRGIEAMPPSRIVRVSTAPLLGTAHSRRSVHFATHSSSSAAPHTGLTSAVSSFTPL
jgi:L-ascorbate metabolism protein UlaG (beta-lactamase superfamily)